MNRLDIALGAELLGARKRRKWTRKDVQHRLPFDVSLQTIATWELGTRHTSIIRFIELADVLGEPAERLIARARRRMKSDVDTLAEDTLTIDLTALSALRRPGLQPLARWAQCILNGQTAGQPPTAQLGKPAITRLAELCDTTPATLLDQLSSAEIMA